MARAKHPTGIFTASRLLGALTGLLLLARPALAANQLEDVEINTLPGDQVQIRLVLSGPAPEPASFAIDNPARVAVDLADTRVALAERRREIGVGAVQSLITAEAKDRTRVVVNLSNTVPYTTSVEGNSVLITLGASASAGGGRQLASFGDAQQAAEAAPARADRMVRKVDFRRGTDGAGRVTLTLSDPKTAVDVKQQGGKIIVDFLGARVPEDALQRYNVTDFATPVQYFDVTRIDSGTRLVITPLEGANYEQLAYQSDDLFVVELKPLTPAELEEKRRMEPEYEGERLTLNFQDIETRAALSIIADFTGLNIVVSDSVQGNVTLRLQNVPWDQALDIILKSKGLGMRRNGNVIMIAPMQEIAQREQTELEALQQKQELVPLQSEFIQVNYAKASELAALIGSGETSLLSERGTVTVDQRTNTLLVQDTPEQLAEIRRMVERLDIPVRQVLIESRIVIANDDFSKELGARVGYTNFNVDSQGRVGVVGGSVNSNTDLLNNLPTFTLPGNDRLNVNLPVANPAGRIAFAVLGSDYLVDLELSALQAEGKGEVVSSPRVLTSNQKEALIEQGVEIPYQQNQGQGQVTIQFKKAVLSLTVTPQITPDDRIIMDLAINKDSVGEEVPTGTGGFVPSIDTRKVQTQVLVDNGETVVLGGIYETTTNETINKVPLLGDIPLLGVLFRSSRNVANKSELLVFITPRIVDEQLSLTQYR